MVTAGALRGKLDTTAAERPVLYLGVAEPLVESAMTWKTAFPAVESPHSLSQLLRSFPRAGIGAYNLRPTIDSALTFRTRLDADQELIEQALTGWSGSPPQLLSSSVAPLAPLLYRRTLSELQGILLDHPVHTVSRLGLTLHQLQDDLKRIRPEIVLLYAAATEDGCLLLEDGLGGADPVAGEELVATLSSSSQVTFLAASYSDAVVSRAMVRRRAHGCAFVHVRGRALVDSEDLIAFQRIFITSLLRASSVGRAFDAARQYLASDPVFRNYTVGSTRLQAGERFFISPQARWLKIEPRTDRGQEELGRLSRRPLRRSNLVRRDTELFVGRRREAAEAVTTLISHTEESAGRCLTLCNENGIGKTSLAVRIVDWAWDRMLFPAGVLELSCRHFVTVRDLLSALLILVGSPHDGHREDTLDRLIEGLNQIFPQDKAALLLLDHLDALWGVDAQANARERVLAILSNIIQSVPNLRVLVTCQRPLGLGESEVVQEVPPLAAAEGRDLFLLHLDSTAQRRQVTESWDREGSAIRRLLQLSGCHPRPVTLLARQLSRPGLSLEQLCQELENELWETIPERLEEDEETTRLAKVDAIYNLAIQLLSEDGKRVLARLSRLPSGVWCSKLADEFMTWRDLLGANFREILDQELRSFALVHFEPEGATGGGGTYELLAPMKEYAQRLYRQSDQKDWESSWLDFWRQRITAWNGWISGRLSDGDDLPEDQRQVAGALQQQVAIALFARTQASWMSVFDYLAARDCLATCRLLLELVSFCELSGQRQLLRILSQRAVDLLRAASSGDKIIGSAATLGETLPGEDAERLADDYLKELGASRIRSDLAPNRVRAVEPDEVTILTNLGIVQSAIGSLRAAHDSFADALSICRRLAESNPTEFEGEVASMLNNLGDVQCELAELDAARQSYQEALGIYRQLRQEEPDEYHVEVARTLNRLGAALIKLDRSAEARECLVGALEIYAPLWKRWSMAFGHSLQTVLHNYTRVVAEDDSDPWWQLYRQLGRSI
jgi:tetratricopeptide (TPR) repeat protein